MTQPQPTLRIIRVAEFGWTEQDADAAARQGWALRITRDWSDRDQPDRFEAWVCRLRGRFTTFETNEDAARYVEEHAESDPLCARAWALVVETKLLGHLEPREVNG